MTIGWVTIIKTGSKLLMGDIAVVLLVQTSKLLTGFFMMLFPPISNLCLIQWEAPAIGSALVVGCSLGWKVMSYVPR